MPRNYDEAQTLMRTFLTFLRNHPLNGISKVNKEIQL
jgi:hypothetical protein